MESSKQNTFTLHEKEWKESMELLAYCILLGIVILGAVLALAIWQLIYYYH